MPFLEGHLMNKLETVRETIEMNAKAKNAKLNKKHKQD